MDKCMELIIPDTDITLHPGNRIKLGRFSKDIWTVQFGWFSFDGNRSMCGWFLTDRKSAKVKPLLDVDLYDCYMVE